MFFVKFHVQFVKYLSRALFAAYLFMLLWLVLFKFSYEPAAVIRDLDTRSVNLIPFTRAHTAEMILNLVAFIPFGVLVGVNFKPAAFIYKIASVFALSLALEIIQFVLAIGVTDITDVIMNTLGGAVGLWIYTLVRKNWNARFLDHTILIFGALIVLAVLYLRIFVFVVRY